MAKRAGGSDASSQAGSVSSPVEHPAEFRLIGPRGLSPPSWRDLVNSSWKDPKYRRIAMSCFVEAAYLLELDRQEKRTAENCLAPNWWKPFKYKLVRTLVDERDGSIYGALLEWDQLAAMTDLILVRPGGAPKAVIALRGTILRQSTVMRDMEDDFRFFAKENLRGSVRFTGTLEVLRAAIDKYGTQNVCIGGHSLGAGFALQVGKTMAKEGKFVECHLFNPPSLSLGVGLRRLKEKAFAILKRNQVTTPSDDASSQTSNEGSSHSGDSAGLKSLVSSEVREEAMVSEVKKWVPTLYINNCDYICCHYEDREANTATVTSENSAKGHEDHHHVAAKLFVIARGPKKFLEAHGLQQWWSDDAELNLAVHDSRVMYRQLKSLYVKEV